MDRETIAAEETRTGIEERFIQELASLLKAGDLADLPVQLTDEEPELPDLERWRY